MSTFVSNSKSSPESPTFAKSSYRATHYTSSVESARTTLSANSNDILVGEQWLVLGRIGEGSFGEVFEGEFHTLLYEEINIMDHLKKRILL